MMDGQVALYARVSSDQQAEANTIDSQVAELRERITADGVDVRSVLEFIDAGYSGSSLVRPALERLRDVAAAGGIDRLYVHCPDRFARHFAYQVLLLEELTQRGVEVIFLNRPLGHTPEDQLLLQVQGVIAEYERAKLLERSRRGKRHAAQQGRVGVLCHAPYGYRYVNKQEGGGDARFDIVWRRSSRGATGVCVGRTGTRHDQCGVSPSPSGWCTDAHGQSALGSQDHLGYAEKPCLQRRSRVWQNTLDPWSVRASMRLAADQPTRAGDTPAKWSPKTSGSRSQCRHLWMRPYSMPSKHNWTRTDGAHGSPRKAAATYYRACSSVVNAGMRIVGVPMMHAMHITAAQER